MSFPQYGTIYSTNKEGGGNLLADRPKIWKNAIMAIIGGGYLFGGGDLSQIERYFEKLLCKANVKQLTIY